jgi:hypothetical protein
MESDAATDAQRFVARPEDGSAVRMGALIDRTLCAAALSAAVLLAAQAPALGDVIFYRLPTSSGATVALEGTTTVNPGGSVTYTHPRFGRIFFDLQSTQIHKVPTIQSQFGRVLRDAGKDPNRLMEAAQWALKRGLLMQFYSTVEKVLEVAPQHPRATLVKRLKAEMDAPLGDSSQQAAELRKFVGRPDMEIKLSKHFILLHDTPSTLTRGQLTRADERIQLLETVYECFLLRFYAYGVELDVPKERLKVVLFNDHDQFKVLAERMSPGLSSASGFWDGETNISVFFDHGTNEYVKALKEVSEALQAQKKDAVRIRAGNAAPIVRLADTVSLLVEMEREDCDVEVVSHEATHQMAGNTGLLPRHVRIPSWVHEGLATYFETPDGGMWGGIGAVNESRLSLYRALEPDKEHSNIGFIVGDQIFDYAGSHGASLHGYGQAWALTHFLLEKHFDKTLSFYRRLGELPPDTVPSQEIVNQLFDECIGIDRGSLDQQWRAYMRSLKTNIELVLEEK